jgi:hypothetical protein
MVVTALIAGVYGKNWKKSESHFRYYAWPFVRADAAKRQQAFGARC